jgi:hypothetical protein
MGSRLIMCFGHPRIGAHGDTNHHIRGGRAPRIVATACVRSSSSDDALLLEVLLPISSPR